MNRTISTIFALVAAVCTYAQSDRTFTPVVELSQVLPGIQASKIAGLLGKKPRDVGALLGEPTWAALQDNSARPDAKREPMWVYSGESGTPAADLGTSKILVRFSAGTVGRIDCYPRSSLSLRTVLEQLPNVSSEDHLFVNALRPHYPLRIGLRFQTPCFAVFPYSSSLYASRSRVTGDLETGRPTLKRSVSREYGFLGSTLEYVSLIKELPRGSLGISLSDLWKREGATGPSIIEYLRQRKIVAVDTAQEPVASHSPTPTAETEGDRASSSPHGHIPTLGQGLAAGDATLRQLAAVVDPSQVVPGVKVSRIAGLLGKKPSEVLSYLGKPTSIEFVDFVNDAPEWLKPKVTAADLDRYRNGEPAWYYVDHAHTDTANVKVLKIVYSSGAVARMTCYLSKAPKRGLRDVLEQLSGTKMEDHLLVDADGGACPLRLLLRITGVTCIAAYSASTFYWSYFEKHRSRKVDPESGRLIEQLIVSRKLDFITSDTLSVTLVKEGSSNLGGIPLSELWRERGAVGPSISEYLRQGKNNSGDRQELTANYKPQVLTANAPDHARQQRFYEAGLEK